MNSVKERCLTALEAAPKGAGRSLVGQRTGNVRTASPLDPVLIPGPCEDSQRGRFKNRNTFSDWNPITLRVHCTILTLTRLTLYKLPSAAFFFLSFFFFFLEEEKKDTCVWQRKTTIW